MLLELKNAHLKILINKDRGARFEDIIDLRTNKNWLWHPPDYKGAFNRLFIGDSYDDNWTGGWDDLFPNDAECKFMGRTLPDHGEIWSQSWQVLESAPYFVKLQYECKTIPCRIEKTISLSESEPQFSVNYRIFNLSESVIPYLFKLHPAISIEVGDQILMPKCLIEPVDIKFSKIIGFSKKTEFPSAVDRQGKVIDISIIPSKSSELQEFIYCSELTEGKCGILNQRTQSSFNLSFNLGDFPYVWQFQTYGGWRNHFVIVMEPCTNIPKDLDLAYRQGSCAVLGPNENREYSVTATISSMAHNDV